MVWLTATGLLAFSDLTSGDWVMISAIYIGGQAIIDGIARMKGV
jgi:urocanate hydratase